MIVRWFCFSKVGFQSHWLFCPLPSCSKQEIPYSMGSTSCLKFRFWIDSLARDLPRAFYIWTCITGGHLQCAVLNCNTLIFKVYQVGSVGALFFTLFASSLAESNVLKRPFFLWFHAAFVSWNLWEGIRVLSSHLFWTSGLWTYQPGSHRRKAAQDFSALLLRCLS